MYISLSVGSTDISDGPFNPYFGSSLLEDVADLVHLDDRRLGLVAAGVEGVRVGRVGTLHHKGGKERRRYQIQLKLFRHPTSR